MLIDNKVQCKMISNKKENYFSLQKQIEKYNMKIHITIQIIININK